MKLSINWLRKFVEVNETPIELANKFISLGLEAEVLTDDLIDLEITPNRGDALSILGLAREYAALTNQKIINPETLPLESLENLPGIELGLDPKGYHRLSAITIENVKVSESPNWLQTDLRSVGLNPINNIVDLTNYVMYELGIPLHAFDLNKITDNKINLRLSEAGEQFISLKDEALSLPQDSIVVESGGNLIDLVGIRGGKQAMITDQTTNLFVWALSLPRPLIRKTVKLTGLTTDAAYRHERETDWSAIDLALARFIFLLQNLQPDVKYSGMLNKQSTDNSPSVINWKIESVNQLLGTDYSNVEINDVLKRLGFKIEGNKVTVPSWRVFDIKYETDLIEEVARIIGYNNLPKKLINSNSVNHETDWAKIENLKDELVVAGFTEVYTESFASQAEVTALGFEPQNLNKLLNPVNQDFSFCRPSALPNLIKLVTLNSWADEIRIFEIANVFPTQLTEQLTLSMVVTEKNYGLLEERVAKDEIEKIDLNHPLAKLFKLRRTLWAAQLPIQPLISSRDSSFKLVSKDGEIKKISNFPPLVRDISVIVDRQVDVQAITDEIYLLGKSQIILVELFDQFQSDKFGPSHLSYSFHVIYQSLEKTLDTADVDSIHGIILNTLVDKFQAVLR